MNFFLQWLVTAIAAAFAVWLVPGLTPVGEELPSIALFALAIALVNASVRPVMQMLSLPLTIVTLGLFHLVINALALMVASWLSVNILSAGVMVASFGSAFWGAIIISIASSVIGSIVGLD